MTQTNELGQIVGDPVDQWAGAQYPEPVVLEGQYCRLEPLNIELHAGDLFESNSVDSAGNMWTYLRYGPFNSLASYQSFMAELSCSSDPLFYAIVDAQTDKALGVASYLRVAPQKGSIEVGHVCFSPLLQKTRIATEAMYLMMKNAFDLGYRRYEWKCNALNEGSCKAAKRLGFTFEGIFRQDDVSKGRNRDTAWFSILDSEWPAQEELLSAWLASSNFDEQGKQISSLEQLKAEIE